MIKLCYKQTLSATDSCPPTSYYQGFYNQYQVGVRHPDRYDFAADSRPPTFCSTEKDSNSEVGVRLRNQISLFPFLSRTPTSYYQGF
jgi:hypothetical protein